METQPSPAMSVPPEETETLLGTERRRDLTIKIGIVAMAAITTVFLASSHGRTHNLRSETFDVAFLVGNEPTQNGGAGDNEPTQNGFGATKPVQIIGDMFHDGGPDAETVGKLLQSSQAGSNRCWYTVFDAFHGFLLVKMYGLRSCSYLLRLIFSTFLLQELCDNVALMAAAAAETGGIAAIACSCLPVAGALVSGVFGGKEPDLNDVMEKVDSTYKKLQAHFDESLSELKAQMTRGFAKLSHEIAAENMDETEDRLAQITTEYKNLIQESQIQIRDVTDYDQMATHVRPGEFADYLRDVLRSIGKDRWQTALQTVPRFLQPRSQLFALFMAQCAKAKKCTSEMIQSEIKDVKSDMQAYQKELEHQVPCVGDISNKHLADLSASCFNIPELHHPKEYASLKGDLKDLPVGVTQLDLHGNKDIIGDLSSLQGLTQLKHMDFHHNEKITGDLGSLQGLKQLKHLDFGQNERITGDLSSLQGLVQLKHMDFHHNEKITGDLGSLQGLKQLKHLDFGLNLKITGDLSSLQGLKQLKHLDFRLNFKITGDLSSLQGLVQLKHVDFSYTDKITGDLSSLQGLTQLKYVSFYGSEKITGDASALKAKLISWDLHLPSHFD